ncbi:MULTISPECIES: methyltransferase family protein [Sorangium]|uniref:methyltransferase family protein n=1 Tax=Sorangium TaxID=39643 RepID=UPI003D9C3D00
MDPASAASPHEHIIHLSWAYIYSAALNAVAELGVADRLEAGPRSAASLADELGVQAADLRLERVVKTPAMLSVIEASAA